MGAVLVELYGSVRLLSLDVALAALGGGLLAERVTQTRMPGAWYLVLPAAVWCVYTLDHLLDARRVGAGASTPRHRFHHRHFRSLAVACLLVGVATAALAVTQLRPVGVWLGVALAVAVGAHLGLVRLVGGRASPLLIKELGVGLIFTAGIWGPPAAHRAVTLPGAVWLLMGQYFLLVMINLIAFSWYEHHLDSRDGHTSFVRGIGPDRVPRLVGVLLLAAMGLGAAALAWRAAPPVLLTEGIYAGMVAVLGLLVARPGWFAEHERYRVWGDAAFLLPWLVLMGS